MAAITLQPMSTSAEVRRLAETMRVIVERRVALTPVFDGAIWSASVEIRGDGINRRRILRTVSATAATPREAIERLVAKLDGEPQEREMFEGDHYDC